MYLGSNLVKEKPIDTISDKSKIAKRGFDPIYGFRKRPK